MAETFSLPAERRTITGKKVKQGRLAGKTPAVMYGRGFAAETLSVPMSDLKRVFRDAGTSTLVALAIEGEAHPINVLMHEPDYHPTTDMPLHIDFYRVRMDEKITTEVTVVATGTSPVVLEQEGTLVQPRDSIEIEALPGDLIPEIEVDISVLANFDDQIRVDDLKLPEAITILTDPEEVLFMVQPPRSEEEQEELEGSSEAEEAEAIEALNAEKPEAEAEAKDEE